MRRLVDRFGEQASGCSAIGDLRLLLADAVRQLGFDHFALLHHASLRGGGAGCVRIDNYPESWVDELLGCDLAPHDPVHSASLRTNTGFAWTEIETLIPLSGPQKAILARSLDHGIGDGFTVPVNVPGEPSGSCSFAVKRGTGLPRHRLRCAELVGAHAFRAARRIRKVKAESTRPHLSRRELECLRLVALGKTDWEIAQILDIGVETARHYVKSARSAYGVATRTQLAIMGLRDDWFSMEEAVPPQRFPPTGG